ncbi:ankyrin repeat domain-containing protein [Microbaculum marinum]|uniref:Ankyrin repeat domain-containing protein n=1 Tax=Microbaculum marinum TaxID=1764581 RepID=A0AAW9RTX6_9HYPH
MHAANLHSDRLNLDYLRKAAKDLKRAIASGETDARARFEAVFPGSRDPKLADCLHVIARENGYESWPKLKLDVELRRADRDELAARLATALYYGRPRPVERILTIAPDIAETNFPLQLALFEEDRVRAVLDAEPERVTVAEKAAEASRLALDPLTRVCISPYFRIRPDLADTQLRIVRHLIDLGADPNVRHEWPDDPKVKLSVLYAAMCVARNLPLAELLLEAGADPNDNECAYHACEFETLEEMRLLLKHGVTFPGTNALFRMLDFDKLEGVELLLQNGADPNEHLNHGGNALRHAIRRGRDGRFADLLIRYGADTSQPDKGRSPYALAAVHGNSSMMEALARHGLETDLSREERFLAAVVSGRRRDALELWAQDKDIVSRLSKAEQRLHNGFAAQKGRLEALELMNEVGFDPNMTDFEKMTPLHIAAWFGHSDYVRFYLGLDPDIGHINMYGATALGNAVHGSVNCPARDEGDYIETARLLVDAGFPILPERGHLDIGSDEITAFLEERLAENGALQTSG